MSRWNERACLVVLGDEGASGPCRKTRYPKKSAKRAFGLLNGEKNGKETGMVCCIALGPAVKVAIHLKNQVFNCWTEL
tara:strand:+ start:162 stop:395 length:234 start_codon:yes stop_codon:yes gene_type:complete